LWDRGVPLSNGIFQRSQLEFVKEEKEVRVVQPCGVGQGYLALLSVRSRVRGSIAHLAHLLWTTLFCLGFGHRRVLPFGKARVGISGCIWSRWEKEKAALRGNRWSST